MKDLIFSPQEVYSYNEKLRKIENDKLNFKNYGEKEKLKQINWLEKQVSEILVCDGIKNYSSKNY